MRLTKLLLAVVMLLCMLVVCAQENKSLPYNLQKAAELYAEQQVDEAMKYINKEIEETPKSADAFFWRARIHYGQQNNGNALTDINRAISLWNKKKSITEKHMLHWWRAYIYSSLEMYDKSFADFDIALNGSIKQDDKKMIHEVLYSRAQLHYELNDFEKADADYNLMLKYNEADQVAMIGLVRNLIDQEKFAEAVKMADQCEKFDNSYSEVYRFRMQAYDKLDETDKAIDDAINYYKTDESPESSIVASIFKKHLTYSVAKVNEMMADDPQNVVKWKFLRTTLYELGYEYAKAIADYNSLESEYGANKSLLYYRSKCYAELGDFEQAIADITRNIEMGDGNDYFAIERRADYYRESGQYAMAINDFSKLIEIAPTDAYAYYKRGWCYELSGNDDQALKDYNAGIDVNKKYPYIYLMRGELYHKRGNRELAKADFEEVLRRDTVADSGSCRQYALYFLERNDEAIEWMEKIIASEPDAKGSYYDKACLLSRMGEKDEAIAALKTAFEKGYRSFAHIKHDDDMDNIRNHPDFIAFIEQYKAKPIENVGNAIENGEFKGVISEIKMKKMYSGIYEVPCSINGLQLKFVFDTGASSISLSSVEASFMLKNGYLKEEDIKGKEYFSTATGEIHEGTIIRLREIKIGDALLKNVEASVVNNQQAPLLLGQTVLERFGTITIDNINSKLVIKQ